jgi:molybdopterin molybdotransferase
MISVEDAERRVIAAFSPLESEIVAIGSASGRVLAEDARARMTQPPASVSSMDGYAVRAADAVEPPSQLRLVGSSPAGRPFEGFLSPGEAVRIFTGGVVPHGADAVVIQEDADLEGERVTLKAAARPGRHIRAAGYDFHAGDILVRAGKRLGARDVALLAAGDLPSVKVRRRPRVALAATGDELSRPGAPRQAGGIVASSGYAIAALIDRFGGETIDLGIFADTVESVSAIADRARDADLVVTMGGASVGDHDLILKALGPKDFELDFWKIAMRPGKPLIFGRLGGVPLLGLPGNPVSTFVCALLFLRPAIAAMLGADTNQPLLDARLAQPLGANDARQDYLRAALLWRDGEPWVDPFTHQDSAMQSALAAAGALILRPPHAPALDAGSRVRALPLTDL